MKMLEPIVLKKVRLAFPSLFKKTKMNYDHSRDHLLNKEELEKIAIEQKLAYEATLLLDKKEHKEDIKNIKTSIVKLLKDNNVNSSSEHDKLIQMKLKDGDGKANKDGNPYQGYEGKISILTKSTFDFSRLDQMKKPVLEEDNLFYAGCYVNAVIKFAFITNTYGRFLAANLMAIQFNSDGEKFQSSPDDLLGIIEAPISAQDAIDDGIPF